MAETSVTARQIREYLAGDLRAEWDLFERHWDSLLKEARTRYRSVSRATGKSAEDLVGEAFVRILRRELLESFKAERPGALLALLRQALKWSSQDELRRLQRLPSAASLDARDDSGATSGDRIPVRDPSSSVRLHIVEAVTRCRARLDSEEWKVWYLATVEGCAHRQIAEELGVSEPRSRTILFRAREKVSSILSPSDPEDGEAK